MTARQQLQEQLQDLLDGATWAALASPPGQHGPLDGAPGAVALIAHRGEVVAHACSGWALAFDAEGHLLPETEREPVTAEHVWDVASVTKLLTAVTALVQVDAGVLDLDRPVAEDLPELAAGADPDRRRILPRHLLTHTAGLPAVRQLWRTPGSRADHARRVLSAPLTAGPGQRQEYSCVGYLVLGLLLERLTGRPLPELVQASVTGPLGMTATGYDPGRRPVVATEYQQDPPRGLVRGQVHDETAWTLGDAGNAGIFATAGDLLAFGEEVRTGAAGLLTESSRALLHTGTLTAAETGRVGYDQAVGFRLGQESLMATTDPGVLGHSGFTGTAVVIDSARELVTVLLTNRVHPHRDRFEVLELRQDLARIARTAT